MEELKVTVENGVKELVIREGKAPDVDVPQKVSLSGIISAPSAFAAKRSQLWNKDNCHVVVNRLAGKITLIVDETSPRATVVTGTLTLNPKLMHFGINTDKMWKLGDLAKFVRMNRISFAYPQEHTELLDKLVKFSAKIEAEIKHEDDKRGNTLHLIQKRVQNEIPLGFELLEPVWVGFKPTMLHVDILCDLHDGGVMDFWLESVPLAEEVHTQRDSIIEGELLCLKDFVIIEQ